MQRVESNVQTLPSLSAPGTEACNFWDTPRWAEGTGARGQEPTLGEVPQPALACLGLAAEDRAGLIHQD